MLDSITCFAIYLLRSIKEVIWNYKITTSKANIINQVAAVLIRNTHSIEKGLSIENPRLGFGKNKISNIKKSILELAIYKTTFYDEVIAMGLHALSDYYNYHIENNYTDKYIEDLGFFIRNYDSLSIEAKSGGVIELSKKELSFNIPDIEKFLLSRHSIRDFSPTPVDNNLLHKAIILAQSAPSACNRQGVRAYVIGDSQKPRMIKWLEGIGEFYNNDGISYILITAKRGMYNLLEINQYIVSASIFSGFLALTLHLYGLGACIIQREVVWSKEWNSIRKEWDIPFDEQSVCVICTGSMKEKMKIPVSHRFQNTEIVKFL
jgi:nitroreductase